jgi:tripartite-type tricarboxylate transporter receptor subunit TctC
VVRWRNERPWPESHQRARYALVELYVVFGQHRRTPAAPAPHMSGELFKMAGVNIVHVPYRGNALALSDLINGQVQAIFDNRQSST